jgi:hypothetical protein
MCLLFLHNSDKIKVLQEHGSKWGREIGAENEGQGIGQEDV